jgi:1,4-dihydroxy-2-naphthoate octaprenyltransferase
MQRKFLAFLKLSRAYFLPMSALPYFLGVGLARHDDLTLDTGLLWGGLAVQLLVQLSVSFLNDYWDIETDRINQNRTPLSGGSGELTTGVLHPRVGLLTGIILQGLALIVALIIGVSGVSWAVLAAAIFLTQVYTMPPIKLCYRGLGEISAGAVSALIVPAWAYALQADALTIDVLWVGVALLPFLMGMLIGIATPDIAADARVGKNTLPVIVGEANVAQLYAAVIGVGYVLVLMVIPPPALFGVFLSVPLAWLAWRDLRHPNKDSALGWTLLVLRPGLVTLVVMLSALVGVWTG